MIQIRNVPEELHRTLKSRAARLGMSLSAYLLSEIERVADRPTLGEWLDEVERLPRLRGAEGGAVAVRRSRGGG